MSNQTKEMNEHAELWKLALENSLDGLWDWDLENDDACYFSPRYYTMLGYQKDEFKASAANWQKLVHPDDFAKIIDEMKTLVTPQNPSYTTEVRMRAKNGEWRWILTRGKVIKWSKQNQPLRMMGIHTDITQRKKAEEDLRESQAQAKALLDASTDAIALVDENGVLYACNNVFLKRWNVKEEDIIKKFTKTILPRPTLDERLKKVREILKTGKPQVFIDEVKNRFFEISMAPMYSNENQCGVVAIFSREITAQKKVELTLRETNHLLEQTIIRAEDLAKKAEAANHAKTAFLANISHEIRTPLNSILGLLEHLKETPLSPEQNKYIETIQRSGKSLFELLSDVIDLSSIERGNIEIGDYYFDLLSLVRTIFETFAIKAKNSSLILHFTHSEFFPEYFRGDAHHLRQCLNNLLSNAIKFTTVGEIALDVQLKEAIHPDTEGKIYVWFTVSDTGIGIAPEKQEKIFERFEQSDSSVTRQYGGTGLGLSITKELIEQMGGSIHFESELGKGTSFTFFIPLIVCSPAKKTTQNNSDMTLDELKILSPTQNLEDLNKAKEKVSGKRILVVDDNEENRLLIELHLHKLGCHTTSAIDGEEAYQQYIQGIFDAIVMDIQMPVMDGLTSTKKIRSWEKENNKEHTPILACTAHALLEDREHCLKVGCDEYITKPVSRDHLIQLISRILKD